ncbi:DNA primase [Leucobacter denitrificans]|uniref:DNA primase n=1 Tax=Leucobacter denitrificans TaxID=683042 RepID=A0A7G9S5Q6_9MICO|nr:DNA primase [Leucobacter denitrificans]QNN63181.1 DNA primase [Leucobacter denitrificans]
MAGRIKASDVEEVKRRTNIADLVSDHVALKTAGIDSMKGLCPFHDERSPSFHVRPALGYFHCFGCGESGDAISFVQKVDHLSFAEAVERLAAKIHYVLTYEEGTERREDGPNRARLLAANQGANSYFRNQLMSEEATEARAFLERRGFAASSWEQFGVGYAPKSWDALTAHLRTQGYTPQELVQAGLVSEGNRGVYDRFRGRIVWPIRDTSGQTLGFGARKLYEDDNGPKYLNTPETPVYHKSRVLYGIDLAKKAISRNRKAVIVEGYTDVMACHLAGVEVAVATCGTAFGAEHITMLRRMMGDDAAAEVIFTFDPDEAGQKAALRAFSEEQRFTAQTYAAVAPDGYDPADLRLHKGDEAVRELFERKVPLFEFALRQSIARFDLNSVEGRVNALRQAAPIVAGIKDPSLRPGYARELARMLGMELGEVQQAVRGASKQAPQPQSNYTPTAEVVETIRPEITLSSLRNTPTVWLERDAIMAMLQQSQAVGTELLSQAVTAQVTEPQLRVVRDAIAQALPYVDGDRFVQAVLDATPPTHQPLVRELVIATMPQRDAAQLAEYSREVVISLLDRDLASLKQELLARMQRVGDSGSEASRRIQQQLAALEGARRALRHD